MDAWSNNFSNGPQDILEETQLEPQRQVLAHLISNPLTFGLLFLISLGFLLSRTGTKNTSTTKSAEAVDLKAPQDSARLGHEKDAIVLFGSQTGTAEDYARRLGRTLAEKHGLDPLVLSMEDCSLDQLIKLRSQKSKSQRPILLLLVVATYGDGEPPDNAVELYNALSEACEDVDTNSAEGLHYAVFGLGNKSYEHFNKAADDFNGLLKRLGGTELCSVGAGDDNAGTTDEDYEKWKSQFVTAIDSKLGISALEDPRSVQTWQLEEQTDATAEQIVYLGERNEAQVQNAGLTLGPYSSTNPYHAPVSNARHLFNPSCGRYCLHMELNIKDSDLQYETGDHVTIWPINPEMEVERFLHIFGLADRQQVIFQLKSLTGAIKHHSIPGRTTYQCAARHYLDICGPVSRSSLESLIQYAPTPSAGERLSRLSKDPVHFNAVVHSKKLNLAQLLESLSDNIIWSSIPFTLLLDHMAALKPRNYSISSSSRSSPQTIAITAVIKEENMDEGRDFKGLASQYLMAVAGSNSTAYPTGSHQLMLSRNTHTDARIAISTRTSTFRLPSDPNKPIIMIGPGTGAAPFRAFLAEKELQSRTHKIGKCVLFTGCRRRDEDFIYKEEWESYKSSLGDGFELHVAFSRETSEKVYVQHLLKKQGQSISELLGPGQANVYICGDVKMAKDVTLALAEILVEFQRVSLEAAQKTIIDLRTAGRLQEDVW